MAVDALGRTLPNGAEVHHVNGDPSDNRPTNLVVCEGVRYHKLLHYRQRALAESGNANHMRCSICKKWGDPTSDDMWVHQWRCLAMHRSCNARYHRRRHRALALRASEHTPRAPSTATAGG